MSSVPVALCFKSYDSFKSFATLFYVALGHPLSVCIIFCCANIHNLFNINNAPTDKYHFQYFAKI